MTRKIWTCDFQGCNEIAQWYRKRKGRLIKVCTKHEARLAREHWGRRVDFSELNDDDIRYLEWKEWKKELSLMSKKGVRIEQQALASKSLEFVAEEYLPEKIEKNIMLP